MISQPYRVGVKSREAPVGFANNRKIESMDIEFPWRRARNHRRRLGNIMT
jgi:hypothetical protein